MAAAGAAEAAGWTEAPGAVGDMMGVVETR